MMTAVMGSMASTDAILLGRVTFHEWASCWPQQAGDGGMQLQDVVTAASQRRPYVELQIQWFLGLTPRRTLSRLHPQQALFLRTPSGKRGLGPSLGTLDWTTEEGSRAASDS